MFKIKKTFEISAAHKLSLPYKSKCNELHGHNYIITVYCASEELDENGMVVDFTAIEKVVQVLDHSNLNKVMATASTAENIAYWIYIQVPKCYQVDVQESEGNVATYVDEFSQKI